MVKYSNYIQTTDIMNFLKTFKKKHLKKFSLLVGKLQENKPNLLQQQFISTNNLKQIYHLILKNYSLNKVKFLNIRLHDYFVLGKIHHKLKETNFIDFKRDYFIDWILNNFYNNIFNSILEDEEFIISIERNKLDSKIPFIHFHLIIFNKSNKQFENIIKKFKQEFTATNSFVYRTIFGSISHSVRDTCVVPKRYKPNEKHYALKYYMGFDKYHIMEFKKKQSQVLHYTRLKDKGKDFSILNKAYQLFPYTGCKNDLKKKIYSNIYGS